MTPVLEMPGLVLHPGEIALVLAVEREPMAALTERCCGLRPQEPGEVRFLGEDWDALRADAADRLRARIGAVTLEGGWPPQLSVADSVILPAIHHRLLDREAAVERASDLCCRFGLPGLPLAGPAALDEDDLARAALARALVGRPDLLILERPLRETAAPQPLGPLLDAIAAGRHAATLWMTGSAALWSGSAIPATRRYRLGLRGLEEWRR